MQFNYTLYHKFEKAMQAEDPLSRRSDHEEGVNLDNQDQTLLKPELITIQTIKTTHDLPVNDEQILREVKEALLSDDITKNYKSLLQLKSQEFHKSLQEWNYENGLLLW